MHPLMQFFEFGHLPERLQIVSAKFFELACSIDAILPANTEKDAAFHKLLEAKDCAVRTVLYKD